MRLFEGLEDKEFASQMHFVANGQRLLSRGSQSNIASQQRKQRQTGILI